MLLEIILIPKQVEYLTTNMHIKYILSSVRVHLILLRTVTCWILIKIEVVFQDKNFNQDFSHFVPRSH